MRPSRYYRGALINWAKGPELSWSEPQK